MEHKTASRCRRVDVFGQGPKAGPAFPDRLYNLQEVLQRPSKAVILRDGYNVTVAELLQHSVQFRARAPRPADLVCEDLLGTGCRKGIRL